MNTANATLAPRWRSGKETRCVGMFICRSAALGSSLGGRLAGAWKGVLQQRPVPGARQSPIASECGIRVGLGLRASPDQPKAGWNGELFDVLLPPERRLRGRFAYVCRACAKHRFRCMRRHGCAAAIGPNRPCPTACASFSSPSGCNPLDLALSTSGY